MRSEDCSVLDGEVHLTLLRNVLLAMALAVPVLGQQSRNPSQPIYRVTIVQRTTPAINYTHRSEPTKIDFRGTALLPQAHGDAMVENRRGATMVYAHFKNAPPPHRLRGHYLTYVIWAIRPVERAA